jgi:hypothetical protein
MLECHGQAGGLDAIEPVQVAAVLQPGKVGLDNRAAAGRLAAQLAPYEKLWAVDGIGGAVFGTVAEQLGRLAAYLGRPDEAARHLAAARDRYERRPAAVSARFWNSRPVAPTSSGSPTWKANWPRRTRTPTSAA